jgi:hypothetical protein
LRFANWDRLVGAFGDAGAHTAPTEAGEAEAVIATADGITVRVSAGLGDQVGRRLFKAVLVERRLPAGDWDRGSVNGLNNMSPAIGKLGPDTLSLLFPAAATELGTEEGLAPLAIDALSLQRPAILSSEEDAQRIEAGLSSHVGLVDDVEAHIRSISSADDAIFASRDAVGQRFHFNILIGDGFLEDAAVRDMCGHLVSADFYDPHYRNVAMWDVERAQEEGRSVRYKTFYANQWNCDHGLKYWRLRATIVADRLVFRMPFLVPTGGSLDFTREFDAINLVISHDFHYRGRSWRPIGGNLLTTLGKHVAMDLLKKAFF